MRWRWAAVTGLGTRDAATRPYALDDPRHLDRVTEVLADHDDSFAVGRALRGSPGVLLMIEPTRGVDVGARAEIYRIMREMCDQGFALVMTSSDLEEVACNGGYRDHHVSRLSGGAVSPPRDRDPPHPGLDTTYSVSRVEVRA